MHPDDPELSSARARLRERGFIPPAPRELPAGAPSVVRARLSRRSADDLADLAGALVTLPDPTTEADRAAAAMELLLLVPGEETRAERLLEGVAAAGGADPTDLALWRFRLGAARLTPEERADAERWEALLAPVRATPAAAPQALRLAAATWLEATPRTGERGADWIVAVLDRRHVVNAALARLRRPALGAPEALGPAFAWLDEAATRETDAGELDDAPQGTEALVAAADRADRAGDVDRATRLLADAAAAATDDRLDIALAARAALLVDPSLGAHAAATQTALAHRRVPAPSVTPPPPPRRDWTGRLLALAAPTDDADLALLEAAGAPRRAARGWLARGDAHALQQATRLREHLSPEDRDALAAALASVASDDEVRLASDASAREAATARWWLLPSALERRLLFARLAALLPDAPPLVPDDDDDDDPHSVGNRLSAAADLLDAGRLDAAVTVLVALLRKTEGSVALRRLGALTARALEHDPPPPELTEAVEKHLHAGDAAADALLEALTADPTGAYALHETLLGLGTDVSRPDPYRVSALAAWLAIWSATRTPPSDAAIAPIARADAALLALAAARVAGAADPVGVALDHLARHPLGAPDDARADDLLALSVREARVS